MTLAAADPHPNMLPAGASARATSAARRPHLDELDRLRIITAVAVVGVHAVSASVYPDHTQAGLVAQDAVVTALHFTREMFMFVTGFALVYVYAGTNFSVARFWKRRSLGVLVPYALWSVVYVCVNPHPSSPLLFARTVLWDLLTGNASYQLYYILLTIEFYLLLPWFLRFLRRAEQHPWRLLAVSFALEVAVLATYHDLLPVLPVSGEVHARLVQFFDRFVLTYQFYFILGALAAQHQARGRRFALRHLRWLLAAGGVALAGLELHFAYLVAVEHAALSTAVDVLQPVMAPYTVGVIAALFGWAVWRVARNGHPRSRRARRVWCELSDASFGIYLVHPLVLGAVIATLVPRLDAWPAAVVIAITWALAVAGATGASILLMHTPLLSRLVGRPGPMSLRELAARMSSARHAAVPATPSADAWKGEVGGSHQSG
ncbi:MAG: acyltransferase [Ktedonobacterales bacterium]